MDNRKYIFRGKKTNNKDWVEGSLLEHSTKSFIVVNGSLDDRHEVDPITVSQFTGLFDKNGTMVFEGDCLQWYIVDEECFEPSTGVIVFVDGAFVFNFDHDEKAHLFFGSVHKIEDVDRFFMDDWDVVRTSNDGLVKMTNKRFSLDLKNKDELEFELSGIRVIGNIHDNPSLLNQQQWED